MSVLVECPATVGDFGDMDCYAVAFSDVAQYSGHAVGVAVADK